MKKVLLCMALVAGCSESGSGDGIDGNVYKMSVANMEVQGAIGVGALLRAVFSRTVYVQTYGVTDTSASMLVAMSDPDSEAQDMCLPTSDMTGGTWDGTTLAYGPKDTEFSTADVTFNMQDLDITATFDESGDNLTDILVSTTLDVRALEGSGTFGDPAVICTTFGGLGVACGACDDGETFCADLTLEGASASLSTETIEAVTTPASDCP